MSGEVSKIDKALKQLEELEQKLERMNRSFLDKRIEDLCPGCRVYEKDGKYIAEIDINPGESFSPFYRSKPFDTEEEVLAWLEKEKGKRIGDTLPYWWEYDE